MTSRKDIAAILQPLVANSLSQDLMAAHSLAGVIGDSPSQYSKSPALWNAAFRQLGIDAIYLPFDVERAHLGQLLGALRNYEGFIGANVTVPHKVRVMDWLDELDAEAARVQAVNTIVKTLAGKLIGYNTDGAGFIDSLLLPAPGRTESFMSSLNGIDVLLLGAGGSARAVALHLSDRLGKGNLIIANRTRAAGELLAKEIRTLGRQAIAVEESEVATWAPKVSLIVNSTVKGQGGVRKLAGGQTTTLEPYSALATASPPPFPAANERDFEEKWRLAARADIDANNRDSETLAKSIPQQTRFYDLIYHPEETVFLRHGRMTGHRTMNGKNMIVCQAVIAFCKLIRQRQLAERSRHDESTAHQVAEVMYRAW